MRGIWGGKSGNSDNISDGREFECDCSANGATCPCTRWGPWVPAGRPVPNEVRCDKCSRGNHSG